MKLFDKQRFYPWVFYSRKLSKRIESPSYAGYFSLEEAALRGMRLVSGTVGGFKEGNMLAFYWLVDEMDGVIADAKFQVFGHSALIGFADVGCELVIRKNYDQARRMHAELIDKHLRDKKEKESFSEESYGHLNLVLSAIDAAADRCMDIPLSDIYVAPPMAAYEGEHRIYPGWDALSEAQQLSVLEEVISADIRPYIELDAGGVEVLKIQNGREVVIAYKGNCTSCYSATGATLNAIQQILRAKIHPEILVIPDMSFLQS